MKRHLLWTAAFLCAAGNAFAVEAPAKPVDKPKAMVAEAKLVDDQKRILVPAKVEAQIQSNVTADIEGHVVSIRKAIGSSVRAGEVVLYLENKDPAFTYAKVPVRAPVTGILSQLLTSQMSKVARGDHLFTVINPSSLKINAEISSLDVGLLKPGATGVFSYNGTDTKIRVIGISPLIDSRTGTASAELAFMPGEKQWPPIGTIGQALFEVSRGQVMLLPENSLYYQEGNPMVRLLNPQNKVERVKVELGEQRENLFVIKNGVKTGDRVIVRSSRPIKDGEIVEVEQPEGKPQTQKM